MFPICDILKDITSDRISIIYNHAVGRQFWKGNNRLRNFKFES